MTTSEIRPNVRNIMRIFRAASEQQRSDGRDWYARARALATELDPANPRRGAAVIAVLSPLKAWEENCKLARAAYAGTLGMPGSDAPHRTLGDHVAKVRRLLSGEDPDTVVSGLKVRAFWLSICEPDNPESVAVDRHALCAAAGRVLSDAQRSPWAKGKRYASVAAMYVRAAEIASRETGEHYSPCALQAVVWVAWIDGHQYERRAA